MDANYVLRIWCYSFSLCAIDILTSLKDKTSIKYRYTLTIKYKFKTITWYFVSNFLNKLENNNTTKLDGDKFQRLSISIN